MNIYDFKIDDINGKQTTLSQFKGSVLLFVNTASECGYTPQYAELQNLYDKYKDRKFAVLAFPSNDFGGQEPGSNQDIAKFCDLRFKVKFPLFSKISVKGSSQAPIYKHLIDNAPLDKGKDVKWNFEKFLVNASGEVIGRYPSSVTPMSTNLTKDIESALSTVTTK